MNKWRIINDNININSNDEMINNNGNDIINNDD